MLHGGLQKSFKSVPISPALLAARSGGEGMALLSGMVDGPKTWELHVSADISAPVPSALRDLWLNAAVLDPSVTTSVFAALGKAALDSQRQESACEVDDDRSVSSESSEDDLRQAHSDQVQLELSDSSGADD